MRVASVMLPIVSNLCKPLGFVANLGSNAMRSITSISEISDAKTSREAAVASLKSIASIAALAFSFFAPILSIMITTCEDIVIHMGHVYEALKGSDYEKAFNSCAQIVAGALYLSMFIIGSLELMVIAFSAQILLGFYTASKEFKEGHLLEGCGQLVLSALRIHQLQPQIQTLRFKWELEETLKSLPESHYVGELSEQWEFPSDHLPVGAKVNGVHVGSWNVLNTEYLEWVTDKNSQGINNSMISRLNRPSSLMHGLTVREALIIHQLLIMTERQDHPFEIFALQECSPQFLKGLTHLMPSYIGMVCSDPSLARHDQNVILYNKNRFDFLPFQSHTNVLGVYKDQPGRGLMDVVFKDRNSGQKFQIVNSHVLGDPNLPGRFHFADYVVSHKKADCITIALGDMNFNNSEMQGAFDAASKNNGVKNSFENLINYYTDIGPDKKAKCIDHLWISPGTADVKVKADLPDEVLPGLQRIVNMLLPGSSKLESLYNADKVDYEKIMNLRWKNYLDRLKEWENNLFHGEAAL